MLRFLPTCHFDKYCSPTWKALALPNSDSSKADDFLRSLNEQTSGPVLKTLPALPAIPINRDGQNFPDGDFQTQLRLTEDQLLSERRSRVLLEAELQQQKTAILSLTAQMDQLNQSMLSETHTVHSLARDLEKQKRQLEDLNQNTIGRVLQHDQLLKQILADINIKQKFLDEARREEKDSSKLLVEEIQKMKFKLEETSLNLMQNDKELFLRTKELEQAQRLSSDIKQVVKDHDMAFDLLQKDFKNRLDAFERKCMQQIGEIHHRVDSESSVRVGFEKHVDKLLGAMKEMMMNQEKEVFNRMSMIKDAIHTSVEKDIAALEKRNDMLFTQVQNHEATFSERNHELGRKFSDKIAEVFKIVEEESVKRDSVEKTVRRDLEMATKAIAQQMQHSADSVEKLLSSTKTDAMKTIKKLQDNLLIIEKDQNLKHKHFEEILRAEVKARTDLEPKLKSKIHELMTAAHETINSNIDSKVKLFLNTQNTLSKKIEDDIQSVVHQSLIAFKNNDIASLDNQITSLSKKLGQTETDIKTQVTVISDAVNEMKKDREAMVEKLLAASPAGFQSLSEEFAARFEDVNSKLAGINNELNERLTLRHNQVDRTLTMLMEEINQRVLRNDFISELKVFDGENKNELRLLRERLSVISSSIDQYVLDSTEKQTTVSMRLKDVLSFKERAEKDLIEFQEWKHTYQNRFEALGAMIGQELHSRLTGSESKIQALSKEISDQLNPQLSSIGFQVQELRQAMNQRVSANKLDQFATDMKSTVTKLERKYDHAEFLIEEMQSRMIAIDESQKSRSQQMSDIHEQEINETWKMLRTWKEKTEDKMQKIDSILKLYLGANTTESENSLPGVIARELDHSRLDAHQHIHTEGMRLDREIHFLRTDLDRIREKEFDIEEKTAALIGSLEQRLERVIGYQQRRSAPDLVGSGQGHMEKSGSNSSMEHLNDFLNEPPMQPTNPSGRLLHTIDEVSEPETEPEHLLGVEEDKYIQNLTQLLSDADQILNEHETEQNVSNEEKEAESRLDIANDGNRALSNEVDSVLRSEDTKTENDQQQVDDFKRPADSASHELVTPSFDHFSAERDLEARPSLDDDELEVEAQKDDIYQNNQVSSLLQETPEDDDPMKNHDENKDDEQNQDDERNQNLIDSNDDSNNPIEKEEARNLNDTDNAENDSERHESSDDPEQMTQDKDADALENDPDTNELRESNSEEVLENSNPDVNDDDNESDDVQKLDADESSPLNLSNENSINHIADDANEPLSSSDIDEDEREEPQTESPRAETPPPHHQMQD